jgi:hypothetical protein
VINDLVGIVPESSVSMKSVGFEVLTAMDMKSYFFWGTLPCRLLKGSSCFRRTYRLHVQGQQETIMKQATSRPLL